MIRQSGGWGVRLRATAPSIHMIRADIDAEISPVVGTEQQSEETVRQLMEDFEEMRIGLTQPEYRNNFYPGQDARRVKGRVMAAVDGEVLVTLEGPGFPKREARLPQGGGEIDFDTTGFQDGTAVLTSNAAESKGSWKEIKYEDGYAAEITEIDEETQSGSIYYGLNTGDYLVLVFSDDEGTIKIEFVREGSESAKKLAKEIEAAAQTASETAAEGAEASDEQTEQTAS
jgi:hypothetical protein